MNVVALYTDLGIFLALLIFFSPLFFPAHQLGRNCLYINAQN